MNIEKKTLLQNFLIVVCSLILFFSVLEIATRLFWDVKSQKVHVGLIIKEGNKEITHESIQYKTNSLSLRNKEIQMEKPEGVKRILALGDSFIWGDGLPEEELITVKIENSLNKKDVKDVEVVNSGVSDFNTADEFNQLVRLTPIYDPDLVILFFFTNDVLEVTNNGEIKGEHAVSWKLTIKEILRNNFKFVNYLYSLYKNKYVSKIGVPQFMLPADYFNLNDSKPGWVVFKDTVLKIQNYCLKKNIGFLFVMIPTLTNMDKNYPYMELREKVVEFIKINNIHLIDLFDLFAPYQPSDLWVSLENSHWNGKATTMATSEVVSYIGAFKLLK